MSIRTNFLPIKTQTHSCVLSISSDMASTKGDATHNPGNFTVTMPNTVHLQRVIKITPQTIAIPKMFNNITPKNNKYKVVFVQAIPVGVNLPPPVQNVQVDTFTMTIPVGIYTPTQLATAMNIAWTTQSNLVTAGPGVQLVDAITTNSLQWQFNTITNKIEMHRTIVAQNAFPIVEVYIQDFQQSGTNQSFFDAAGLTAYKSDVNVTGRDGVDSPITQVLHGLIWKNVNRAIFGLIGAVPDSEVTAYGFPQLDGPPLVHIVLKSNSIDSFVDGSSGSYVNVLATIPMGNATWGQCAVFDLTNIYTHDTDFDIDRDFTNWQVAITDSEYTPLTFPPNFTVSTVWRAYHTDIER